MLSRYAASFWIRLVTRLIDFGYPFLIQLGLIFALTELQNGARVFSGDYGFYVWCLCGVLLLNFSCVVTPLLLHKQTIGMWLTRTLLETKKPLFVALLKREAFFALAWSALFLLAMAVLNHTLVNRFAQADQSQITYTSWEKVRVGLLSTLSSFILILQFGSAISIVINREHRGWHDRFSETRTVWQRRYKVISGVKSLYLPPRPVNNVNIEWVGNDE